MTVLRRYRSSLREAGESVLARALGGRLYGSAGAPVGRATAPRVPARHYQSRSARDGLRGGARAGRAAGRAGETLPKGAALSSARGGGTRHRRFPVGVRPARRSRGAPAGAAEWRPSLGAAQPQRPQCQPPAPRFGACVQRSQEGGGETIVTRFQLTFGTLVLAQTARRSAWRVSTWDSPLAERPRDTQLSIFPPEWTACAGTWPMAGARVPEAA